MLTIILLGCVVFTQFYWLRRMYDENAERLQLAANRALNESLDKMVTYQIDIIEDKDSNEAEQMKIRSKVEYINAKDTIIEYQEKIRIVEGDTTYNTTLNISFLKDRSVSFHEDFRSIVFYLFPPDFGTLDSIFSEQLHLEYPLVNTGIELYNLSGDTVLHAFSVDSILFGANDLRTRLLPFDKFSYQQIRGVVVSPQRTLFAKTSFALMLSLLFFALSLACVSYLMNIIFKQKRYSQSITDYIHHVSHQLKAPISVALNTLRFLDTDKGKDNQPARHRLVELSEQSLQKLTAMMESLLFMSVQEHSHIQLKIESFDLPAAIIRLAEEAGFRADKKAHVVMDNQLQDNIVCADRLHLCDAVSNLIDNAVKYSGDEVNIVIRISDDMEHVCITVKDDGIGIAPEYVGHIFEKFFRVEQSGVSVKGFGLGLSYVQAVCNAHGGIVSVVSNVGVGSKFVMTIPKTPHHQIV